MAELLNTKHYNILDINIKLSQVKKCEAKSAKKLNGEANEIIMFWYGDAFSLRKKDTMLVAFSISTLIELKNLGPWKQIDNFLKLVLQWSN